MNQSVRFSLRGLSVVLLFICLFCLLSSFSRAADTYQYVVLIGVDGAGAFFKEADTPQIDRIFQNGSITYEAIAAMPSISAECWGSMLHGVTPSFHGLTNAIASERPYDMDSMFPSVFRVIRENNPKAVLASFCTWPAINFGIVEDEIGVLKNRQANDDALVQAVCAYLQETMPNFLFVAFDEPDAVGHAQGFGSQEQLACITRIDEYIGEIFRIYRDKNILANTLFIVTADHGGNETEHGGDTDAEMQLMYAVAGKTVQAGGAAIDMQIRDNAAIILHAFGYAVPETWTARVPSGVFVNVEAGARPVYPREPDTEQP